MPRKKPDPARRVITYPGVFPYETTAGTRYRYAFDIPPGLDGTRRTKTQRGFASEQDAWEAMQERKRELRQPGYVDPTTETLDAYYGRWLRDTAAGRRPSSNGAYERAWALVPESVRALPLVQLTPTQIRHAYAHLVAHYTPATCRLARAVLVMVLKAATRDRLIPSNPAQDVRLPISRDAEAESAFDPKNVWTVAEARRFLTLTADHPHHVLWRLLLDSGLRIGEALALTWDDLVTDDEGTKLRVTRTVTRDAAGHEVLGRHPKTESSRREVGLMTETVAHLERARTEQKVRRMARASLWQDRGLIFDDGVGGLLPIRSAQRRFATAVKQHRLRPLTLHGLRHTMAVTWLQAGESPAVVSARLGHKSAAFTLDVYAKVSGEWQQRAVERVAAFLKGTG